LIAWMRPRTRPSNTMLSGRTNDANTRPPTAARSARGNPNPERGVINRGMAKKWAEYENAWDLLEQGTSC
jgi:hypothetical protein